MSFLSKIVIGWFAVLGVSVLITNYTRKKNIDLEEIIRDKTEAIVKFIESKPALQGVLGLLTIVLFFLFIDWFLTWLNEPVEIIYK